MKIPVRFAAEFDEFSRVRSCQSSGSEHSADLSDLVNSFLEREIGDQKQNGDAEIDDDVDDELESNLESESRASLEILFDCEHDAVKRNIRAEAESAYLELIASGNSSASSPDFKRRLMTRLRSRGLDAGLCKSNWEKNGRHPPGQYEYVDVNACGSRYIIEGHLAGEFTIARPSDGYRALLEVFPQMYVGKADELKQVVRVMCKAIKRSMTSVGIHVPPWRRLAYMESKWFVSHRRTTNEVSRRKGSKIDGGDVMERKKVGFAPMQQGILKINCRQEFTAIAKTGVRMGNLAAILN